MGNTWVAADARVGCVPGYPGTARPGSGSWREDVMRKLKGAVIPEEEFMCTTLRDAARILNVIGLLAEVYKRPEPIRFLALLERGLGTRHKVRALSRM